MTALIFLLKIATHGRARAYKTKTGNHVARGIGWFYMVTTCVIQLSIWLSIDSAIIKIFIKSLKIPNFDIEICGQANGLWTLRRVSRSWHFSISTISRLWEKYHQTCKIMNVHLIYLQHYLNKLSHVCY